MRETPIEDTFDPQPFIDLYSGLRAAPEVRFTTDHGEVRMLLYTELMPRTTARFAELVKDGFYDGTLVHRVVDDFVIQGGDPSKTGQFGSGETIPFESDPRLHFGFGAVGLARDLDPDSGDSQWFLTERPAPHLHDPNGRTAAVFGTYSLYAQVFDGMTTVRHIAAVDVVPGLDRPVEDVVVEKAELLDPPAEVDPLHFPKRLEGPYRLGLGETWLERPFGLFADHPFPLTVVVEAESAETEETSVPPSSVRVTFERDENNTVALDLLPAMDDPWLFSADTILDTAGTWRMTLSADGVVAGPTDLEVLPLGVAIRTAAGHRE